MFHPLGWHSAPLVLTRREIGHVVRTTARVLREVLSHDRSDFGLGLEGYTVATCVHAWCERAERSKTLAALLADRRFRLWMIANVLVVPLSNWPDLQKIEHRDRELPCPSDRERAAKKIERARHKLAREFDAEAERLCSLGDPQEIAATYTADARLLRESIRQPSAGAPRKTTSEVFEHLDVVLAFVPKAERYRIIQGLAVDLFCYDGDARRHLEAAIRRGTHRYRPPIAAPLEDAQALFRQRANRAAQVERIRR